MYELNCTTGMVRVSVRPQLHRDNMWRFAQCTRYIYDLWNPLFQEGTFREMAEHIYLEWSQFGEPECRGSHMSCLGMVIRHDGKYWEPKLYDKNKS